MPPTVLGVMLTSGKRPQMLARAVRSFQAQRYANKKLAVLHSGENPPTVDGGNEIHVTWMPPNGRARSIGELRNLANALSVSGALDCEIIAHFDDDDWSGPERLTEQVELLRTSGRQAVGYHQMLFWDTTGEQPEAWLYSSPNLRYCLGTSLLYWRKVWEKAPFEHLNTAEDLTWQNKVKTEAQSSLGPPPRMIATLHGQNTCARIAKDRREWARHTQLEKDCIEALLL